MGEGGDVYGGIILITGKPRLASPNADFSDKEWMCDLEARASTTVKASIIQK